MEVCGDLLGTERKELVCVVQWSAGFLKSRIVLGNELVCGVLSGACKANWCAAICWVR